MSGRADDLSGGKASWRSFFARKSASDEESGNEKTTSGSTWSMGIMNDQHTIEVPGSVLLLAKGRNEPLGLRNAPARTSHSSLSAGYLPPPPQEEVEEEDDKKKTSDGQIILDPQPDDSHNDPLNWPTWRRDSALLSLGFYCMLGGGITPLIAAGFTNVATDYGVPVSQVSLTTGLYMLGLGLGSVVVSPTAILYGKRPVYLASSIIFILSSVWCALSPNFTSLILARIIQGVAVSPVECLPSATIAEIFFLHERAFRIGIYTLLLLGGKNLIPLISAAIINSLGWRWVFWIVAIIVAFGGVLLFLFVPETFWDRTPIPKTRKPVKRPSFFRRKSSAKHSSFFKSHEAPGADPANPSHAGGPEAGQSAPIPEVPSGHSKSHKNVHVDFAPGLGAQSGLGSAKAPPASETPEGGAAQGHAGTLTSAQEGIQSEDTAKPRDISTQDHTDISTSNAASFPGSLATPPPAPPTPILRNFNSPYYERIGRDYFQQPHSAQNSPVGTPAHIRSSARAPELDNEKASISSSRASHRATAPRAGQAYTHALRSAPAKSFSQQLRIYHGRLNSDKWLKVAFRPFILFSYPAVLWASAVYACSVGWLIVISESVALIYRQGSYHFSALSTGLVYLSPFIGGILGTAVAGRISDVIVKAMARRNGGLYEPEFRLVMAIPVAISTGIGLMGFGWSAGVEDPWIVPTVFFGIVSFGCSLGSTTAITFCVDSYRQYAGEALVTLNFSKNVLHGLVFSLFVTEWLETSGPMMVYIWIGMIHMILLLFTIPMYIYGKRARMWTVRKNFMEKF